MLGRTLARATAGRGAARGLRLHLPERRHRARHPARGEAVHAREGLRHLLPGRAGGRDGARPDGRVGRLPRERRGAAARPHARHGRSTRSRSSSFISSVMTLLPGRRRRDRHARGRRARSAAGDWVEVEISGIGVLRNPVRELSGRARQGREGDARVRRSRLEPGRPLGDASRSRRARSARRPRVAVVAASRVCDAAPLGPPQPRYLNAVLRARDRRCRRPTLLAVLEEVERRAGAGAARSAGRRGRSTSTSCSTATR